MQMVRTLVQYSTGTDTAPKVSVLQYNCAVLVHTHCANETNKCSVSLCVNGIQGWLIVLRIIGMIIF